MFHEKPPICLFQVMAIDIIEVITTIFNRILVKWFLINNQVFLVWAQCKQLQCYEKLKRTLFLDKKRTKMNFFFLFKHKVFSNLFLMVIEAVYIHLQVIKAFAAVGGDFFVFSKFLPITFLANFFAAGKAGSLN